jgi:Short-chain dehydrogenases of various substrate specificities
MNKRIVVTGGTRGIGKAILERFASENFDLITCARNESQLAELKAYFAGQYPAIGVTTYVVDVSKKVEVERFCAAVREGGAVDVLVNNAGFFIPGEIISEADGALESMIEANLYSAYYTTRGLAGDMVTRKEGHIFNICSIASINAYPNGGSYAISKFALLGFSKCIREELKNSGIRVTSVLPGATLTSSWEGAGLPDERFMPVEDVAESIYCAWKMSPRSVVEEILIRPQLGDI